jgi:sugar lactone lactonase YvrE
MSRRTIAVSLAAAAVVAATVTGTAEAAGLPRLISGNTASQHPEGVAWDPTRQTFLVSSMREGGISVVDRRGDRASTRPLVTEPRMVSTFGVHVDAARGRVLTTYADLGVAARSTPETVYTHSGLGIFDLATGATRHLVDLAIGAGRHGANDLALDWAGNAYVSDPASDRIYRVTPEGQASVLIQDPRLGSPSIGLNGIVWHPAGFLLAVRYDTGALLRIPLRDPSRITEVRLDRPLIGGDGMALRPDGTLVVVTNKLGAPGQDAVTLLNGGLWFSEAREVRRETWPVEAPTTVAVTPHGSYAVSGRLPELLGGSISDEFDLRRF